MKQKFFLSALGIINSLGSSHQEILHNLITGNTSGMVEDKIEINQKIITVGKVQDKLPQIPKKFQEFDFRSNQILLASCL